MARRLGYWGQLLLIALIYCVIGRLGLLLAIDPGFATSFFPAAGVALALLWIWGLRYWPAVLLGSWLLNSTLVLELASDWLPLFFLVVALGVTAALQALLGIWLLRVGFGRPLVLSSEAQVLGFYLLVIPLATLPVATIGTLSLWQAGLIVSDNLLFTWWTWWSGDCLGVLIVLPIALCLFARPRVLWRKRLSWVALPLVVTSVAILVLYAWNNHWEQERLRLRFERQAEHLAHALELNFAVYERIIGSIERFYAGSERVSRLEFRAFVRDALLRQPGIQALEWIPRVPAAERARFERAAQTEGFAEFAIRERTASGQLVRAGERAVYYPVLYAEPLVGNEQALGFDLGSTPDRLAALQEAARLGEIRATAPIELVQESRPQPAVLLFFPVYSGAQRQDDTVNQEHLAGFALGVFRVQAMIEAGLEQLERGSIALELFDIQAPSAQQPLYSELAGQKESLKSVLQWQRPLEFAGRSWLLRFSVPEQYRIEHRSGYRWAILIIGYGLAALVGGFLLIITGHTVRIEELVNARTLQLAETEAKMAAVVDSALDGILTLSQAGLIESANPAAGRLFGCAPEQLVGQQFKRWLADEAVPFDAENLQGGCFEIEARRSDGAWLPLEICISPIATASKDKFSCLLHDLSEQKRGEQLKNEFLSTVSHELRTPLTSIYGGLQLVLGGAAGEVGEKVQKLLTLALNNSERLSHLINDLLDIQKIEAGCLEYQLEPLRANQLLQKAAEDNNGYAEQQQVCLVVAEPVPDGLWIEADRYRIDQVLANLISNAVKFSPRGAEVYLSLSERDGRVRFAVRDQGCGIPVEFAARIFQRFAQADSSDRRGHGGTGLGLSISKALIEQQGGEIGFDTEPGAGSCFYFYLPQIAAPQSSS